jgi:Est1 DNA/RNA binding domain
MVEKKCVEIDQQQSKTTNKLSDEQWQALIALHRTLLYEHHDFFLASQHPSSSAALRRLATKYAMPARMWRHGIHSFLELLRHRLPDSLDHMLAFVYLAYSMMALLMESVPSFVETWIECLGDLARYRMAIEEVDLRDREIWSGCAKMWYEKAADKSPNVGRIQHHLAVLARPNIVQQLFYYSKALVSVTPFQNARESVMLLFNPLLQDGENISQKYIAVEAAFVTFHGVLFIHGVWKIYWVNVQIYLSGLDAHIGRIGSKFRTQGPEIVSSLCAAAFDFGNPESYLTQAYQQDTEKRAAQEAAAKDLEPSSGTAQDPMTKLQNTLYYWASLEGDPASDILTEPGGPQDVDLDSKIPGSNEAASQAIRVLGQTTKIVTQRIGDKNIVPYMHVFLAFLWGSAHVAGVLQYVQAEMPWEGIITFLNTLGRSGVDESHVVGDEFPQQLSGTGRQLPEDFPMRGLSWARHYFPAAFFQGQVVDEDERTLDLPSHAAPRAERCLWLGVKIASVRNKLFPITEIPANSLKLGRWIAYNKETRKFALTDYGHSLMKSGTPISTDTRSVTLSVHSDDNENDIQMIEQPT